MSAPVVTWLLNEIQDIRTMNKSGTLDTIRMQVMWNRLISVVEEQAQTLMRTAFSPIVRECGDLSAGVFDPRGRMLAQAITGTPGHVNSMAESVNHFIDHFPLETMVEGVAVGDVALAGFGRLATMRPPARKAQDAPDGEVVVIGFWTRSSLRPRGQ